MSELFSEAWMKSLQKMWNDSEDIAEPLSKAGFSSCIGYGFKGDSDPTGMIVIRDGVIVEAGKYDKRELNWDLRATKEKWNQWIEKGFSLATLGPAVATKTLEFAQGEYRQMIRNPSLSGPFLNHFKLMTDINKGS